MSSVALSHCLSHLFLLIAPYAGLFYVVVAILHIAFLSPWALARCFVFAFAVPFFSSPFSALITYFLILHRLMFEYLLYLKTVSSRHRRQRPRSPFAFSLFTFHLSPFTVHAASFPSFSVTFCPLSFPVPKILASYWIILNIVPCTPHAAVRTALFCGSVVAACSPSWCSSLQVSRPRPSSLSLCCTSPGP